MPTSSISCYVHCTLLIFFCIASNDAKDVKEYSKIVYKQKIEITDAEKDKLVPEQIDIEIETYEEVPSHYYLALDQLSSNNQIINAHGLVTELVGSGQLVGGVRRNGVLISNNGGITIQRGPVEVHECFFDLQYCRNGYSLSFWINFLGFPKQEMIYMSSGSHDRDNHGIFMTVNERGEIMIALRSKDGKEWRLNVSDQITPNTWLHFFITWSQHYGLYLYVNGKQVSSQPYPHQVDQSTSRKEREFFFGGIHSQDVHQYNYYRGQVNFLLDELHFWMDYKHEQEIKELGPISVYRLPIASIRHQLSSSFPYSPSSMQIGGRPNFVTSGKTEDALEFNGRVDYIVDDLSSYCFHNVSSCFNGFLLAAFIKFGPSSFERGSYINTGSNGFKLDYQNKALVGEVYVNNKIYRVQWKRGIEGQWYFVELSYDPGDGLKMSIDNRVVSKCTYPTNKEIQGTISKDIQVGRLSQGVGHQAFTIDDFELWYGDKEMLLNLGYIIRGRPDYYHIPMDSIVDYGSIPHANLSINVYNRPRVVPGKVKNAINLDGNSQYIYIASQPHYPPCFMNLNFCRNGATLIFWIKPGRLINGLAFLSTGTYGFKMWQEDDATKVSASTVDHQWSLMTNRLVPDRWQLVELSFNPSASDRKLKMFIDNKLVGYSQGETSQAGYPMGESKLDGIYFAREDGTRTNSKYGNFTIDEVEYWMANRDYLLKFNFIQRGKLSDYIYLNMDEVRNNRLVHSHMEVNLINNPTLTHGKVNLAIKLNGRQQYLDLGSYRDSCFGNLALCPDGMNSAMWLNFNSFPEYGYIFSSGGGVQVFTQGEKLMFVMEANGKKWETSVTNLKLNKWYFVEYTWKPEFGIQVYVNNHLVSSTNSPTYSSKTVGQNNKVFLGAPNLGEPSGDRQGQYGDVLVDEFEFWFQHRDHLIASKNIIRDAIQHIWFTFETKRGNIILHPHFQIYTHNGAQLTSEGAVGNGLLLGGTGEHVSFGDQRHICMGNLALCSQGITISMLIKPHSLPQRGYILSGGPYSIYTDNGKVHARFTNHTRTWTVSSDQLQTNKWQQLDISWHPDKGLEMFIDQQLVGSQKIPTTTAQPLNIYDYSVYLGRPSERESGRGSAYANASIDELQYWYASRDLLDLDPEISHIILDMDVINNKQLFNKYLPIYVEGGASNVDAVKSFGVYLNGVRQYLEASGSQLICLGNLNNCQRGFTLRFKVRPDQLRDNQYLVSSSPLDIFINNQRLHAEMRTEDQIWKVASSNLNPQQWYQVDLSWSPVDGASLYIDGVNVDSNEGRANTGGTYNSTKNFYVGRANTDMFKELYANAVFDDMQFWEAKRDLLLYYKFIFNEKIIIDNWSTISPPPFIFPPYHNITNTRIIFDGKTWITYNSSTFPPGYKVPSTFEDLSINLLLKRSDGLLWYSGDERVNTKIYIKGGLLYIQTYNNGDVEDKLLSNVNINDQKWHRIFLTRNGHNVTLYLDEDKESSTYLKYLNQFVYPNVVYIGGTDNPGRDTNYRIDSSFWGGINNVIYRGSNISSTLNFKEYPIINPRPGFVDVHGNWILEDDDQLLILRPPINSIIIDGTDEKVKPANYSRVSFTLGDSFIMLPVWNLPKSRDQGMSLELKYQTLMPSGVLVNVHKKGSSQSLALIELYDGIPYLVANFGRGYQRIPFGNVPIKTNDNREHYIKLLNTDNSLKLSLDGDTYTHYYVPVQNRSLDIKGGDNLVTVGGAYPSILPWHTWNEGNHFFRGCVWDVRLNMEEVVDLWDLYMKNPQGMSGVSQHCKKGTEYCGTTPCRNGGRCHNVDQGYVCDCSDTKYTGKICDSASKIVTLTGKEKYDINFLPTLRTHTNDFSIRFKTPQKNAFLFSATNHYNSDLLKVTLDEGIGKVESRFGGATESTITTFECVEPLNDNEWHTAHIKRRANYLEAYVDDCSKFTADLPGENYKFLIDTITLGRDDDSYFIGYLQNLYHNGINLFGPSSNFTIHPTINPTDDEHPIPFHVVTIRSNSNAYLTYPSLNIVGNTKLQLMFKTSDPNGIILYNPGFSNDFFAVELVDGRLHVLADDETGVQEVTSSAGVLSDSRWHLLEVEQISNNLFAVIIDKKFNDTLQFEQSRHTLDLMGNLYVGSVPEHMKHKINKHIKSTKGYSGCLASFVVNRIIHKLDDEDLLNDFITAGCTDARGYCLPGICYHEGVCKELNKTYICDCNLTTYVGNKCSIEGPGWEFGENYGKGIILYEFKPPRTTNKDEIALAFYTFEKDGTLLRANSTFNNKDDIHIELVNGEVVVTYKIDGEINRLVEKSRIFNNGKHHRVVFIRTGNNATLTVDDLPSHTHHVHNLRSDVLFNDMSLVKVGGDLDANNNIINYFIGIISGVYINGVRVFDEKYVKTGSVGVATHPLRPTKLEPTIPTTPIDPHVTPKPTLPTHVKPTVDPSVDPDTEEIVPAPLTGGQTVSNPLVGPRAAGIAGAMLGLLLLASSAMWAFFRLKPGKMGLPPVPSSKAPVGVGAPTDEKPSLLGYSISDGVEAQPLLGMGAGVAGSGVSVVGGGAAVNGTTFISSGSTSAGGVVGAGGVVSGGGGLNQSVTYSYEHNQVFSQQGLPMDMSQPSSPGGHFSMRNVDLSYGGFNQQDIFTQQQQQRMLQQQQQLINTSTLGQSSTMNRNLMAAEEIRVDCVQMTNNGRYVVTGSNCGPPQVWDLKTGELVKVMKGDEFSSTDLHLANGDTLLVGQVAELEPVDAVDANRVHQRRLQVWDFETGKPIEMSRTETCTASCMMSDGERMLLGRTDRFGGGTTIVVWDILSNEPVRQIKCDSSVGFADHISYLNVTKDSRYVIAGFQNTYDGTANYVTFDLASTDINASGMRVSSLDADVDVTALLNDKEAVTGTRKGELIVWSVKTGKQLRRLGGGVGGHTGEVKDVVVSKDGQLLVSASTDGSIKVWDVDSESLLHTLTGHRDEVWCCTLSPDNELVGSGSRDGTIRLWKVSDGTSVAAIDAGMTIFKVLLSNNKKTVVALADKGGARKLIMLRVVRSTATIDRRNQIISA